MSFFSKTEIKDLKSNHERIIRIAVSNVLINPTIAVTTSNKIHLFNESGDKHQYELSRSITPTCVEWHPFNPILAIGWDNGNLFEIQEESPSGTKTLKLPSNKVNHMQIQL
jgi:intraflagellar transport protein 140